VNVLVTLATENAVSEVTGLLAAMSARPALPRQTDPSAKMMATETPGIADFDRSFARRASSAAWRAGVALGGSGVADATVPDGTGPPSGVPGDPVVSGLADNARDGVDDAGGVDATAAGAWPDDDDVGPNEAVVAT
jgi:hypothetical protein